MNASSRGFTLVETLLAVALTGAALAATTQLAVQTRRAHAQARDVTMATLLARDKLEALLSAPGRLAIGGEGLEGNAQGWCDFFDASGRPVASASGAPEGGAYVRRWSISRLAAGGEPALLLQVVVRSNEAVAAGRGPAFADARARGGVQLVAVRRQGAG